MFHLYSHLNNNQSSFSAGMCLVETFGETSASMQKRSCPHPPLQKALSLLHKIQQLRPFCIAYLLSITGWTLHILLAVFYLLYSSLDYRLYRESNISINPVWVCCHLKINRIHWLSFYILVANNKTHYCSVLTVNVIYWVMGSLSLVLSFFSCTLLYHN